MNVKSLCVVLSATAAMAACSTTPPVTGEVVERASLGSGVSVTALESRSVLPSGGLAGQESAVIEFTAAVEKINAATRVLTLRTSDGQTLDFTAGPEVRNFPQIKKGDRVRVAFVELVEFEARQPTAQEIEEAGRNSVLAERSEKGKNPAAIAGVGTMRILKVCGIDKERGTVTLDDNGRVFAVKAKYPQNLALLHVGDPIVVKVAELVAGTILPAE